MGPQDRAPLSQRLSRIWKAITLANLYIMYANFPVFIRKRMNAFLSRLKKALFSR